MAFIHFDNGGKVKVSETLNELENKINKADLHEKIRVSELVRTSEGREEKVEIIIYHTKITKITPHF